ncbi:hypothetical protein CPX_001276 [Candidatus Phytoplasma pruni]|uniref:Uncharacterized protein n=1 Tax=Candidatus Phytoplasma pruni TaxID=479893 RepID=A0A0M1N0N7_9MOLU|nr:hypothetical protein [Candidatus Phytoplasma pruni]KOR75716.1 hypothetical protein CPX_001276 [Candidatus Phytoplasma pruni]MDW3617614.1 hypothetical protein [Candidatus Phytoplasma pruni]
MQNKIITKTTENIVGDIILTPFKDGAQTITQKKFTSKPINIKLDDYTTLTAKPSNKLIYDVEPNEKVHAINHLGEEINE